MPTTSLKHSPPMPKSKPNMFPDDGECIKDTVDGVWFAWHPAFRVSFRFDDVNNVWKELP